MKQIEKHPQELDRWENEGGALSTEKVSQGAPVELPEKALLRLTSREVGQAKIGPTRQAAHDRFFVDLMEKAANVPKTLEATGCHSEAHAESAARDDDGADKKAIVNRTTSKAS